jgi:hypothetical protein
MLLAPRLSTTSTASRGSSGGAAPMLEPFRVTFPGVGPVLFTSFDDLPRAEINTALDFWRATLLTVRPPGSECDPTAARDRIAKQLLAQYLAEIDVGTRPGLPTAADFFATVEALADSDEDVRTTRSDIPSERLAATRVDTGALVGVVMAYGVRRDPVDPGTAQDLRVTAFLSPHMPNMGSLAWARRTATFVEFVLDRPLSRAGGRTVTLTEWRFPLDPTGIKLWDWPERATFVTELENRGLQVEFRDVGGVQHLAAVRR